MQILAFLFLVSLNISSCLKSKVQTTHKLQSLLGLKLKVNGIEKAPKAPIIAETFFFLKIYPKLEADYLLEKTPIQLVAKFFVVQDTNFYYGSNSATQAIIEEQIDLKELYDNTTDNAKDGKCCRRLRVVDFAPMKCHGCIPAVGTPSGQLDINPLLANHCLEVDIINNIYWRICHRNKDNITRLKLSLIRATVKAVEPDITPANLTKVLMNGGATSSSQTRVWNWQEQDKWGGNCDVKLMQSPVKIIFDPSGPSADYSFNFQFNFHDDIPYYVEGNGDEVVVKFDKNSNPGTLKATFGRYTISTKNFKPTGMYFRFPAEHLVDANRFDGEVVVTFDEETTHMDPKLRSTHGFRYVIPIVFDPSAPLNMELENLSPDFWRFELEGAKKYKPVDWKKRKQLKFNLNEFNKGVQKLKPDYGFYMGSETTPPCKDRVLYIVATKPLAIPNCQFKIFRENSMTSNREVETHSRKTQDNKLVVKKIGIKLLQVTKNLIQIRHKPGDPPADIYPEPNCKIEKGGVTPPKAVPQPPK